MSLTEPIIEGAYYEREDGQVVGPAVRDGSKWWLSGRSFDARGKRLVRDGRNLTRRVWPVPVDPAEVVAELQELSELANQRASATNFDASSYQSGRSHGLDQAADLVAEKLGVGNG